MVEIKKLFETAKQSRKQEDIDAYLEYVDDLLKNDPYQYLINLEYIISTNKGLSTIYEFVEAHTLPIGYCDSIIERVECVQGGCKKIAADEKPYQEAIDYIKQYKASYPRCVAMYEDTSDDVPNGYLEAYYKNLPKIKTLNESTINFEPFIEKFGDSCVPDLLIYNHKFGDVNNVLQCVNESFWVEECMKDLGREFDETTQFIQDLKDREIIAFKEAALMDDEDAVIRYTESEVAMLKEIIFFKENMICCLEDRDLALQVQNEVYDLYQILEGAIEEDSAAIITQLLPQSRTQTKSFNEMDNRDGKMPAYLRTRHSSITYGEDPVGDEGDIMNDDMDSFERPSAKKDDKPVGDDDDDTTPISSTSTKPSSPQIKLDDSIQLSDDKPSGTTGSTNSNNNSNATTNYYYYNYTNSHNKNTNSQNNSTRDDHSIRDDHSSNKRINSHNESHELWEINNDFFNESGNITDSAKPIKLLPVYGICCNYEVTSDNVTDKEKGYAKFTKVIDKLTVGDNFSHALLSMDPTFENIFSFSDEGFIQESLHDDVSWNSLRNAYINVQFVPEEDYIKMQEFIKHLEDHQTETHYANPNLVKILFGKTDKIDNRFICSTFTSYMLAMSNAKNLHRDYSLMRPDDITIFPRSFFIGIMNNREEFINSIGKIKKLTKAIYDEHEEELIDYNCHLPKVIFNRQIKKMTTFDKLIDWIVGKM